jgi:hypothetical protein
MSTKTFQAQELIAYVGVRARGSGISDIVSKSIRLSKNKNPTEKIEAECNEPDRPQNSPVNPVTSEQSGCFGANPRVQELMQRFARHAYASYVLGTPALSHLPLLTRYNVSSALQRNADILGVKADYFDCNGLSPFTKQGPTLGLVSSRALHDWPKNLLPTVLQRSIEHHPWVDVFPWPQLRDNMLQAFEHPQICDEDEMCRTVVEYECLDEEPLLVVWADAWDTRSWEITPQFLKKWGWLLKGCEHFLDATNYWRSRRDERPISREDLYEAIEVSMPAQLRDGHQ